MTLDPSIDAQVAVLLERYNTWRNLCEMVGAATPDEPTLENDHLAFRYGYPNDGWTGYTLNHQDGGYELLSVSTERRDSPTETRDVFFSHLVDAGKYLIWRVGESVRMRLRLPPISSQWEEEGLDPRVRQISLDTYASKFSLRSDTARYFILFRAGGVQPDNHLLPLSYGELETALTAGLPDSVKSRF